MGRRKDPNSKYRMKRFLSNGHLYAITTDPIINGKGIRIPNITVWGSLADGIAFMPNIRFRLLPQSEKEKFTFPVFNQEERDKKIKEIPH